MEYIICKKCHHDVPKGLNSCPYCGTPVVQEDGQTSLYPICHEGTLELHLPKCPTCGSLLPAKNAICDKCGYGSTEKSNNRIVWKIVAATCFLVVAYAGQLLFLHFDYEIYNSVVSYLWSIVFVLPATTLFLNKRKKLFHNAMLMSGLLAMIGSSTVLFDDEYLFYLSDWLIFCLCPFLISILYFAFALIVRMPTKESDKKKRLKREKQLRAVVSATLILATGSGLWWLIEQLHGKNITEIMETVPLLFLSVTLVFVSLPLAMLSVQQLLKSERLKEDK